MTQSYEGLKINACPAPQKLLDAKPEPKGWTLTERLEGGPGHSGLLERARNIERRDLSAR
jgi:hypothetical protein